MDYALLLLPDFLLIAAGFVICRHTALDRPIWDAVERLVYFLLFPVLLFTSIARSPLKVDEVAGLGVAGVALVLGGVAAAYALGHVKGVDARAHAAGAQTAFRFNSYVALALAERLGGAPGVATVALLMAVCVPLCNVAAVWPLARHGGQRVGRELLRNPLIIATLAGLAANALQLRLPDAVGGTLQRIGVAAIPLGLMAVGAGLRLGALRDAPRLAAALLTIKHVLMPALALVLVQFLPLTSLQQLIVVAFAALPTATSAYVLAARMGGHASYVAGLVTLSTLLATLSLPLALAAFARLSP